MWHEVPNKQTKKKHEKYWDFEVNKYYTDSNKKRMQKEKREEKQNGSNNNYKMMTETFHYNIHEYSNTYNICNTFKKLLIIRIKV